MSDDDIIRIEGVEYVVAAKSSECGAVGGTSLMVQLVPKRKQTGWICAVCPDEGCVVLGKTEPNEDIVHCAFAEWRPFYGKVVE